MLRRGTKGNTRFFILGSLAIVGMIGLAIWRTGPASAEPTTGDEFCRHLGQGIKDSVKQTLDAIKAKEQSPGGDQPPPGTGIGAQTRYSESAGCFNCLGQREPGETARGFIGGAASLFRSVCFNSGDGVYASVDEIRLTECFTTGIAIVESLF